jgi:hypothetical protein
MVGTCDSRKATSWGSLRAGVDYIYWPAAPDWALKAVGDFILWCRDNHGIRAQSTVEWIPYPSGRDVHLTGAQWGAYYGWLGHQHVPENDHGDPGNIDFNRMIALATGGATPPSTGTTMPEKPNRSSLHRAENTTLAPGAPVTLYWTEEFPDDANGHGEGGKTVGSNITYNGLINLTFSGLHVNEVVEVYAAEEYSDGTRAGNSPVVAQVVGRDLGFQPVRVSVPVGGTVGNRLVFEVVSRQGVGNVILEDAWLELHSWPMS